MALAVLNEVALINTTLSSEIFTRRGYVLFGIVVATPSANVFDVLWENGVLVSDVAQTANGPFDVISAPIASSALVGKVVYPSTLNASPAIASPEYRCLVVRAYRRQTNGAGAIEEFVYMKSLQTGEYFEAQASNVTVIPGQ